MYRYLMDDVYVDKKVKSKKKYVIKQQIKIEDYNNYLQNSKMILWSQQRLKSETHHVFMEKSTTFQWGQMMTREYACLIDISHLYGAGPGKVCNADLTRHPKRKKRK